MAEPTSSGASSRASWRSRLAGVALIVVGVGGVALGVGAYVDAWRTAQDWNASGDAQLLAREAIEPTPIRVEAATAASIEVRIEPLPTAVPANHPTPEPTAAPVPLATAEQITISDSEFRFLDPPEPDAHARISVTVHNTADGPSNRILLGIKSSWFESYRIIGSVPVVSEDRTDDEGLRTFSFPPLQAGQSATFELHVAPTGEETRPPELQVLLPSGEVIGSARPPTKAPPPRPGPVMALDIPKLKLKSGVIQTKWEPPPFTIGQIKGTANITTGNTVLVGHLTGAAGNVFGHLDQLEPGDMLTATSRGVPFEFEVSRVFRGANTDASPMDPGDDARLTLMTCAGVWNPITHDYSERLWVIAEAPEQAEQTIALASATATAEAVATATYVASQPTPTPVPPSPPPFVGEPSLAGGLGNTQTDLGRVFGPPRGETTDKLVVFRPAALGREVHVQFTPDPPRAVMLVLLPTSGRLSFDAAVREARRYFPKDAAPRIDAPEGNPQFIVERFTSAVLADALGIASGDFSVIYTRDAQGSVTKIVFGLGDDVDALLEASRH